MCKKRRELDIDLEGGADENFVIEREWDRGREEGKTFQTNLGPLALAWFWELRETFLLFYSILMVVFFL